MEDNSEAKPLAQIERHSYYSEVGWISRQNLLALRSRDKFFLDIPFSITAGSIPSSFFPFDSDLITAPGQATPAVIGAISIFMPWFAVMITPLKHKYAYLSSLESADAYLRAVRADQLWLITLMMSTIGLLTAIKWQSVFPGLGDSHAPA